MVGVAFRFQQGHFLSKLWRNVHVVSVEAPSHPAAHAQPMQEAERLVDAFTSRGASTQLPPCTHRLLQQLRTYHEEVTRKECEDPEVTDQLFSPQELARAQKKRARQGSWGERCGIIDAGSWRVRRECRTCSTHPGWLVAFCPHRRRLTYSLFQCPETASSPSCPDQPPLQTSSLPRFGEGI